MVLGCTYPSPIACCDVARSHRQPVHLAAPDHDAACAGTVLLGACIQTTATCGTWPYSSNCSIAVYLFKVTRLLAPAAHTVCASSNVDTAPLHFRGCRCLYVLQLSCIRARCWLSPRTAGLVSHHVAHHCCNLQVTTTANGSCSFSTPYKVSAPMVSQSAGSNLRQSLTARPRPTGKAANALREKAMPAWGTLR